MATLSLTPGFTGDVVKTPRSWSIPAVPVSVAPNAAAAAATASMSLTAGGTVAPGAAAAAAAASTSVTAKTAVATSAASGSATGSATVVGMTLVVSNAAAAHAAASMSMTALSLLAPTAIASRYTSGFPVLAGPVATFSIQTAVAFGTPSIRLEPAFVLGQGIQSAEAFGSPTVTLDAARISPYAILEAGELGDPHVTTGVAAVAPAAITTAFAFGLVRVFNGAVPRRNRLFDAAVPTDYSWLVNHSAEGALSHRRAVTHGAQNPDVGLVRQQGPSDSLVLKVQGTILDESQKAQFDAFWAACAHRALFYEDWPGDSYEVVLVNWDCRRVRTPANPRHTELDYVYAYSLDLEVVTVFSGAESRVGLL